jgi:heme o synthase
VRPGLSMLVAFSALAGYVVASPVFAGAAIAVFAGVFLFSNAASALNQVQERAADGLMFRTMRRPIPSGALSSLGGLSIAGVLGGAAMAILWFFASPAAAILGAGILGWYCVVYAPLKKKTRFAVHLGAVAGALPPVMGSLATGTGITGAVGIVSLFLYLWQIAHFYLLLCRYGSEYERAGFAYSSLSRNRIRLKWNVLVWLLATCASTAAFPWSNRCAGIPFLTALILANGTVCAIVGFFALPAGTARFGFAFAAMHGYLGVMLLLVLLFGLLN